MAYRSLIAYIGEDVAEDARGPIATGRFSGHIETVGYRRAPAREFPEGWWETRDVSLSEALGWARERAARVVLCVADTDYSAGEVEHQDLPSWNDRRVDFVPRRWPGWEFVDRTAEDEPISWDVLLTGTRPLTQDEPLASPNWMERLQDSSAELLAFEVDEGPTSGREAGAWTSYGSVVRVVFRLPARTVEEAQEAARATAIRAGQFSADFTWDARPYPTGSRLAQRNASATRVN